MKQGMSMDKTIWVAAMAAAFIMPAEVTAQGTIEYGSDARSSLRDEEGNRYGGGTMERVTAKVAIPLGTKTDSLGRVTAWQAALSASYATLGCDGEAAGKNPENIVNAGVNIIHRRPIGRRWSLMVAAGCGVYAPKNEIRTRSILANGGAMFIYRINRGMSIGVGGGLTNAYGVPMVMPMMWFSWMSRGRFELKVDLSSGMEVAVATKIGRRMRIELVAVEMDGMMAVTEIDGKPQIYSSARIGSRLRPSVRIGRWTALFASFGATWLRSADITDRSLRGLAESFREDRDKRYFNPALSVTAGVSYGL